MDGFEECYVETCKVLGHWNCQIVNLTKSGHNALGKAGWSWFLDGREAGQINLQVSWD